VLELVQLVASSVRLSLPKTHTVEIGFVKSRTFGLHIESEVARDL